MLAETSLGGVAYGQSSCELTLCPRRTPVTHNLRLLLPLVIIGGSFTFAAAVLYGAWMLGHYRGKEEEVGVDLAAVEGRLQRVEYMLGQATGAIERLEAAQRQATRMMAEAPANVPRLPGRQVTPH